MRAAVSLKGGGVELRVVPDPVAGPGEAVVALSACGICGSDLMGWYVERKAPAVLGHEPVGRIEALGDAAGARHGLEVGDRVFVHHHVPCGSCRVCAAGRETLCATFRSSAIDPGGFAEKIRVPAEHLAKDVLRLPDALDDDAATLIEPLACCLRGLRQLPHAGGLVVVVGLGQMGQLYVRAARALGFDVIGVDPIEHRRAMAVAGGALAATTPDVEAVRAAGGACTPVAVVACTASAPALELALAACGDATILQLFAPTAPDAPVPLDLFRLFFHEVRLQPTYSAGPLDTREALRLLAGGTIATDGIVTHRFPLEETARALEAAKGGRDVIKVVVEMGC